MKIIEKEFNIETGEEIFTERDETSEERILREAKEKQLAKEQAELKAETEARAALLDKLGLTEEEARLLLG